MASQFALLVEVKVRCLLLQEECQLPSDKKFPEGQGALVGRGSTSKGRWWHRVPLPTKKLLATPAPMPLLMIAPPKPS